MELFDLLKVREGWGREERLAISVGAWMHDVGAVVEIWRHPRHSAYILRHGSVFGLTQRELLLASLAVYLHEGDEAPESWKTPGCYWSGCERAIPDYLTRWPGSRLDLESLCGSVVRSKVCAESSQLAFPRNRETSSI